MQTRILSAMRGAAWLVEGFRLYRRNPPLLTFLTMGYLALALFLGRVRFLGVLLPLAMPTLIVLIANVCHTIDRVLPLSPAEGIDAFRRAITAGLREQRLPLLQLGMLQLCGTVVVVLLDQILPGGDVEALFVTKDGVLTPAEGVGPIDILLPMLRLFSISLPLVLAFWFAPMLTAWNAIPPLKSLFFSLVSVWRNWRPFLAYGVTAILSGALLAGLSMLLAGILPGIVGEVLSSAVSMLLLLVFAPVLMTGSYLSYVDVFGGPPAANGPTGAVSAGDRNE